MIKFVLGNFFDYQADIRINTVNCVGVMGAGVALQFKKRYPEMFKSYVEACNNKEIEPGKPHIWEEYNLLSKCTIINLPTKIHWRNSSKYEYIEKDLIWLRNYLMSKDKNITVTIPALGCGHGGLNWDIIKQKILYYLKDIKATLLLFEPNASNKDFKNITLLDNNINIIYKDNTKYPKLKYGFDINEIYCKGNINILDLNKLNIFCSNILTKKEIDSINKIVDEINFSNYAIVLGLNNKSHLELAKILLSKNINMILVVPCGILKYNYDLELKKYKHLFVIVSYLLPDEACKKFEYINSLKYMNSISDVILYTKNNYNDIKNDIKYFNTYDDLFYINYWHDIILEFRNLNAKKVGISRETKRPDVALLESHLM